MRWVLFEFKDKNFPSSTESPYLLTQSPPPPLSNSQSDVLNFSNKVSPSVLLIILILSIIFFVSGLLHLLIRFLIRPQNRDPDDDLEDVSALQGQLQQLFHLHDSGVDQTFIDTLPIFHYKSIIGVKDPFDCAVCLCEFEPEDKLRLLPKCSHAFHMECIDTWLLSHSTCPLCRASLVPDFSPSNSFSPIVLVLESGSDISREIVTDRDSAFGRSSSVIRANCFADNELGSFHFELSHNNELGSSERSTKDDPIPNKTTGEKVVTVKLGKFRNVDGGEQGTSSTNNVDSRRCFSMGSFSYIMDENSSLQVPIRTPMKKISSIKPNLPLTPGHKPAISECGCDSRREFMCNETDGFGGVSQNSIGTSRSKRDSFSISKIWLRGKKENLNGVSDSSRRAFSFRFPVQRNNMGGKDLKVKNGDETRRTISDINIERWENGHSQLGCDEENQSCYSLESQQTKSPSFARTLLSLMGRQNKVVHSSSDATF